MFYNYTRKFVRRNYSTIIENEKLYLTLKNEKKSFWHDIPLRATPELFNMVIEIPALSKIKLEMNINEKFTPILPKVSKNPSKQADQPKAVRDYSKDIIVNYGFFPQTYSSKEKMFRNLYKGDGDPLDVVEMGGPFNHKAGDILQVKLLGAFCLIDEGEVDWKIVVANIKSEMSNNLLDDSIKQIMHWFKVFKTYEGKKENVILDDNKFFNKEYVQEIIEDSHKDYFEYCRTNKI